MKNKKFKFLGSDPFSGVSQKTGNSFTLYKLKFADPDTYENLSLDYDPALEGQLSSFKKGDSFSITDLRFEPQKYDSKTVVTGVSAAV